jgi:hypothetical protein
MLGVDLSLTVRPVVLLLVDTGILVGVVGFLSLFGLAFVGAGVFFLLDPVRALVYRFRAISTEPVGPGELANSGYVTVTGTAKPHSEGALRSPFDGAEAVAHRYRLTQQTDGVGRWTVADDGTATTFEIQGPVDRVTVDPAGTAPAIEPTESRTVPEEGRLPTEVRERIEASSLFDLATAPGILASEATDPREYEYGCIEPGETVTVHGVLKQGTAGKSVTADDSGRFVLSPGEQLEDDIADGPGDLSISRLGLGLFFALFGLVPIGFALLMLDSAVLGVLVSPVIDGLSPLSEGSV